MTMPDRGKAIRGLECCAKKVCIYKDTEKECPYWELCGEYEGAFEDCTTALANDVLALLKAQEPRVMTLEEVAEGKPYWLDMRGIASEYAICKMNDCGDSAFLDFAVQYGNKTLESNGYGRTWRCWTSRPTDKQREAIPWTS